MMKKCLAYFLCFVLAIAAAGCGKGTDNAGAGGGGNKVEEGNGGSLADGQVMAVAIVQSSDCAVHNRISAVIREELEPLEEEGKIKIFSVNSSGDAEVLSEEIQETVSEGVDVLIPIAEQAAKECLAQAGELPVVYTALDSASGPELIAVAGNAKKCTGLFQASATEDTLALAAELTPEIRKFGFLYCPGEAISAGSIARAKRYCKEHQISYQERVVESAGEVSEAAAELAETVDAFFVPDDSVVNGAADDYMEIANGAGLPVYAGAAAMLEEGALAAVSVDEKAVGKKTVELLSKVLDGEQAEKITPETVSETAKFLNPDAAKTMRISITDERKADFILIGEE